MPSAITLERYLTEDFFTLIGLQDLPQEEKDALLEKMNQTVLARVYSAVQEQLDPAERAELDALSPEKIAEFFESRGFNVVKLVMDEAMRYRMELARSFEAAAQAAAV